LDRKLSRSTNRFKNGEDEMAVSLSGFESSSRSLKPITSLFSNSDIVFPMAQQPIVGLIIQASRSHF
jgi:hypothetical protein